MCQNGRGDGKLTALELRTGFDRLMTHIARRECCCRAYKCAKVPTYGLPPLMDSDASFVASGKSGEAAGDLEPARADAPDVGHEGLYISRASADLNSVDERNAGEARRSRSVDDGDGDDSSEAVNGLPGEGGEERRRFEQEVSALGGRCRPTDGDREADADHRGDAQNGGVDKAASTARMGVEQEKLERHKGISFRGDGGGDEGPEATSRPRRNTVDILFAGKAIACREHALEGMVYLGQR